MNKYQEALDRLKDMQSNLIALNSSGRLNKHRTDDLKVIHRATIKLQELVDKETPMKPIITTSIPLCPRCHEETVMSTDYSMKKYGRCINEECGQRLDWSDEE